MIEVSQQGPRADAGPPSSSGPGGYSALKIDAVRSASFKKLIGTKVRIVAPLLGLSIVLILAASLLAGYDRPFMAEKVLGAFNVGYLLVVLMYCLSWAAAACYVYVANRWFDAQAEQAVIEARTGGHS